MPLELETFEDIEEAVNYIPILGRSPLLTKTMTTMSSIDGAQVPILEGIGTSDWPDSSGDVLLPSFLKCLQETPVNATCYQDHIYGFGTIQGKLAERPDIVPQPPGDYGLVKVTEPFNGLYIKMHVDVTNPEAMRVHTLAKNGYRVGFSPGAHVEWDNPDWAVARKDSLGRVIGSMVKHGIGIEFSSTMMPANQTAYARMQKSLLARRGIDMKTVQDAQYAITHQQDMDLGDFTALQIMMDVLKRHPAVRAEIAAAIAAA